MPKIAGLTPSSSAFSPFMSLLQTLTKYEAKHICRAEKWDWGEKGCRVGQRVNILKHPSYMSDKEGKQARGGKWKRGRGREEDWEQGTVFRGYSFHLSIMFYSQELHNRGALGWNITQHIQSWSEVVYKRANHCVQYQGQTTWKTEQHLQMWLLAVIQPSYRGPYQKGSSVSTDKLLPAS